MDISITKKHKIIIKENAFSLVLDESIIRYIEELSDKAYYIDYTDEDPEYILKDQAEEMNCCDCPWFTVCEAMDDPQSF